MRRDGAERGEAAAGAPPGHGRGPTSSSGPRPAALLALGSRGPRFTGWPRALRRLAGGVAVVGGTAGALAQGRATAAAAADGTQPPTACPGVAIDRGPAPGTPPEGTARSVAQLATVVGGRRLRGVVSQGDYLPWVATVDVRASCLVVTPGPEETAALALPLVAHEAGLRSPRRLAVRRAWVDTSVAPAVHVYRITHGLLQLGDSADVLAMERLLALAEQTRGWADALPEARRTVGDTGLPFDARGQQQARLDAFLGSAGARWLLAVLGAPARPIGLVGDGRPRGTFVADRGQYVPTRDSIALAMAVLGTAGQRELALAHELAHRWLRRYPARADSLFHRVAAIRDSARVGFGEPEEQRAQAIAYATTLLLAGSRASATTPGRRASGAPVSGQRWPEKASAGTEDEGAVWEQRVAAAERLVPGTSVAVRFFGPAAAAVPPTLEPARRPALRPSHAPGGGDGALTRGGAARWR